MQAGRFQIGWHFHAPCLFCVKYAIVVPSFNSFSKFLSSFFFFQSVLNIHGEGNWTVHGGSFRFIAAWSLIYSLICAFLHIILYQCEKRQCKILAMINFWTSFQMKDLPLLRYRSSLSKSSILTSRSLVVALARFRFPWQRFSKIMPTSLETIFETVSGSDMIWIFNS